MESPASSYRRWLVPAAVVAVALAGGAWYGARSPQPVPYLETAGNAAAGSQGSEATITVHVSGAVLRPGLVTIPEPARVADAIDAAGGALPAADLGALNLAATVADGEQIVVSDHRAGTSSPGGGVDDGRVHVNRASPQELEALPGVGPVLAERIYAFRTEHGPFATVEDLLDVPGIGEGKLAALRDAVSIP